MTQEIYDIIIVGGGIMGSSTAFYLKRADQRLKIAVVEPDPTYARASSTLSLGNARIQFSMKENVLISQYTFEVLERFNEEMEVNGQRPNLDFRHEGNLFLVEESSLEAAQNALVLQQSLGCLVEWWTPEKIKGHYPLYETSALEGGTFGSQDGYLDPYAFLMAYRSKARSLSVKYIKDEVIEISTRKGRVTGVKLVSGESLSSTVVVNCAGAWAAKVADTAGVSIPVEPVKRQVFALDTKVKPEKPLPLTVLPSGLYLRSETGGLVLVGKSMDADPVGFNFVWDDKRFMEVLWPELAQFVPEFDHLKLLRGWAGLYAVNRLDGNAILGEWPELKGFYLVNGFSGHGLQQAPAVGRYLSELILNHPSTLDLSAFSPERILDNKPLSEAGLV